MTDKYRRMRKRVSSRQELTREYCRECFLYLDGQLIWRDRPAHHFVDEWRMKIFNARQSGRVAGCVTSGYAYVRFWFGRISVHRLVFLMHRGFIPAEVDHINGNPLDNRIENLREVTHRQNMRNLGMSKANTSGVRGVSFHKPTSKWIAHIRVDGKMKHLGLFVTIDKARIARLNAEKTYYGEWACGR